MSDFEPIPVRLGHSPDPDDAFMWWPLFAGDDGSTAIDTGRYSFSAVADDIESLNERSGFGELEITAISCAQYPYVSETYALTACGASLGEGYGPRLVSREQLTVDDLRTRDLLIAIPGRRTTAYLTSALMVQRQLRSVVVPFEQIVERVADGSCDVGLVIHEAQLTYQDHGLHLIADLGRWWAKHTDLPLPLGANVIRRDLEMAHGPGTLTAVTTLLRQSIEHAMTHRSEAIEYALQFARGLEREIADRFVQMYVNDSTLDYGETGRAAVRRLLTDAARAGLSPDPGEIDFIEATS